MASYSVVAEVAVAVEAAEADVAAVAEEEDAGTMYSILIRIKILK